MEITIKAARINKGYSQAQAAEKLGVCKDTLSNYERGKSYPPVPVLKKMEDIYGVPYNQLIF